MPHINITSPAPGIVGLFHFRPETAGPLCALAETLLRGPSSLTSGEREIIAAFVSRQNGCNFCFKSHAAAAAAHLECGVELTAQIDGLTEGICPASDRQMRDELCNPKLLALLDIADAVVGGGRHVLPSHVDAARELGATDVEIHDTVLIAAAFCMFNRYVDGLATLSPVDVDAYVDMGQLMAHQGYVSAGQPTS